MNKQTGMMSLLKSGRHLEIEGCSEYRPARIPSLDTCFSALRNTRQKNSPFRDQLCQELAPAKSLGDVGNAFGVTVDATG